MPEKRPRLPLGVVLALTAARLFELVSSLKGREYVVMVIMPQKDAEPFTQALALLGFTPASKASPTEENK